MPPAATCSDRSGSLWPDPPPQHQKIASPAEIARLIRVISASRNIDAPLALARDHNTPAAIGALVRAAPVSNTPGYNLRMSDEDLKAELERLKAENEQLKSQRGRSVSLKVSEKGGVSVYRPGTIPCHLI